ncbi:MAG: hypothetical protein GF364_07180 [Candidatus Lokiarchaeota archaeon]|nr:hypothetical protein [Candidatus Lokiarchaeota archaeon]
MKIEVKNKLRLSILCLAFLLCFISIIAYAEHQGHNDRRGNIIPESAALGNIDVLVYDGISENVINDAQVFCYDLTDDSLAEQGLTVDGYYLFSDLTAGRWYEVLVIKENYENVSSRTYLNNDGGETDTLTFYLQDAPSSTATLELSFVDGQGNALENVLIHIWRISELSPNPYPETIFLGNTTSSGQISLTVAFEEIIISAIKSGYTGIYVVKTVTLGQTINYNYEMKKTTSKTVPMVTGGVIGATGTAGAAGAAYAASKARKGAEIVKDGVSKLGKSRKSFEDPLTARKKFEDPLTAKDKFEDPLTAKTKFEDPLTADENLSENLANRLKKKKGLDTDGE